MLAAALSAILVPVLAHAQGLPSNGQIVAGTGSISESGPNLSVNQTSDKAVIDWTSFSISQGNTVQFNNGHGATLNRVTGGKLSSIDGLLSATGSLYLINPNGVIIGKSGVVKVGGGFVASTLDIGNVNFLNGGDATFEGPSLASVVNLGQIGALGGDVALVAANVRNDGTVAAPNGSFGLLAGNRVLMRDLAVDDGKFLVLSGGAGTSATNTGSLDAATVELRAQGGNIYALAGNTQGLIQATGVSTHDGRIFLSASGGSVDVSNSTLTATNKGEGGTIALTGQTINVAPDATLDASGAHTGGTITAIADMASGKLNFHGTAKALGRQSGGFIETSGRTVDFSGARIDTRGAKSGIWLVDPDDLTVDASAASTIQSNLATTNVTLQTTATTATGPGNSTSGSGDIIVNSDISWSSANTLTLDSYHSIQINANVTASGAGGVVLTTNHGGSGGDYTFALGKSLSFTNTAGGGQSLTINGSAYGLIYDISGLSSLESAASSRYALAKSLDFTGTDYTTTSTNPVNNTGTSSIFTGLGHTVSNLTLSKTSNTTGFIGNNYGTVRDIGIVNSSISGGAYVGGLVAYNRSGATLINGWSSAAVTGTGNYTGGLVGYNLATIRNSFATGAINGASNTGGLAGYNSSGAISNSFATGTVIGTSNVGGLVGYLIGGTLSTSFATGRVTGSSNTGGLVGYRGSATLTNSYYDSGTTGKSDTGRGTAQTTAQLQAALPTGFSSSVWGTGTGLYPYLKSFYPNGAQAISGTVDATGTSPVITAYAGGAAIGSTTSIGNNSNYYILMPGTGLTATTPVGVSYRYGSNNTLSFTDAPTLTGSNITGMDLYGQRAEIATSKSLYSETLTGLNTAFGSSTLSSLMSGLNLSTNGWINYAASGDYTVDQPVTLIRYTNFDTKGSLLSINADITVPSNTNVWFFSDKSIAFNANVSATGTSAVTIITNRVGSNGSDYAGGSEGDYSFLPGKSLTFSGTGGFLNINGNVYTLLYSQADLLGIDGGTGDYALANSLDFTGTTFTDRPIQSMDGRFTGLGHTIANLNINAPGTDYIGLIGTNTGYLRDIGITSGTVFGNYYTGALVGENYGQIYNTYAGVDMHVVYRSGGLVGVNYGLISRSHATGSVTSNGDNGGVSDMGGLVGWNDTAGTISQSYATGTVTGTADTTAGLVAFNLGTIADSFATGGVFGNLYAGGLVGYAAGHISNSYATGYVHAASKGGGFAGYFIGTVTNSYWDTTTSGTNVGIADGVSTGTPTGLTRSVLQNGSLPTGFSSSIWATGSGLYPYLKSKFSTGMQSISGYTYASNGTVLPAATLAVYVNGTQIGGTTAASGADGYYYLMATPGTVTNSTKIGITETDHGGGTVAGLAYTDTPILTSGQVTGFDVRSGRATYTTAQTAYSALKTNAQSTFGASQYSALTTALDIAALKIVASGAFSIDQSISRSGTVLIQSGGDLTVTSGGSVTSTASVTAVTLAADGSFINNAGSNSVSASNGRWLIYTQVHGNSTAAATSNSFGGLSGKNYYNNVFNFGTGVLAGTPSSGNRFVTGYAPVLTVTPDTQTLVYNGAVQTSTYSLSGYLTGDQSADNLTGSVTGLTASSKNAGVYALTASGTLASEENYTISYGTGTLTITKADLTIAAGADNKTYDAATTSAGTVSVTGLLGSDTVTGKTQAFDSKNAGTRTLSVTGYTLNDGNSGGNYTVTTQTAAGSIAKAGLTIAAGTDSKTYDATTASAGTVSVTGLLGSDTVTDKTQAFDSQNAGSRTLSVTGYTLNDGNSGGNYTVTTQTAAGSITKAGLTIAAGTDSKTYDATTASAGTVSVTGLLGSDTVTGKTQAFDSKNAGSRTLSVNGYTLNDGNSGGNYTVTTQTAAGAIAKAALTLAAGIDSKTYNATTASTGRVSVSGLKGSDTVTGTGQIFDSKNAGSRTLSVTGYTLNDGNSGGNYTVTTQTASGTINKAALTLAAGIDSKIYDETTASTGTVSVTGLKGSDTVTGTSQAFDSKNAGSRTLSVNGYTLNDGNSGGNYTVTTQTAAGIINKAALTAALTGSTTKTYDATLSTTLTAGNYTLSGLKGSDTVTLNTPALGSYADANTGTSKSVTVTDLALLGTDAGNYTVNSSASANIGNITARKLTLTADTLGKNSGSTDPLLTYVISSGSLAGTDSLTGSLSRATGENPGIYDIGQGSLVASSNYDVSFVKGSFTIVAVALQNDPVVNPVNSSANSASQPVIMPSPIGLSGPPPSDAGSASPNASETSTNGDDTSHTGSAAGDSKEKATGPSILTKGQSSNGCASGEACANTPYPTNQLISSSISFTSK